MICKGALIDGAYQIIQEIGRGGTGVVYLAYHLRLQKYVVLKNARLKAADMEILRHEVDTLKELHHSALPQVYDFLQVNDEIYTVIDYVDGDDFERLVTYGVRFEEHQLANYLLELAEVLRYLHQHEPPILHSDIKPSNIMLRTDGSICLIDFNISVYQNDRTGIRGYTQHYSSPEQCRLGEEIACGVSSSVVLDGRSDIYSLGATLYYIMTGVCPNADGSGMIPLHKLVNSYSPDLIRIVEKSMALEPELRYQTAEQLILALKCYLRRGEAFRKKCITQAVVICVSGLLVCGGIWSLLYGLHEKRHDSFLNAYSQVQYMSEKGEHQQVIKDGVKILNQYDDQMKRNPENWFFLLRAVAESYMTESQTDTGTTAMEELRQASYYYYEAALTVMKYNLLEQKECISICANLLMSLGDQERLKRLTSMAETYGMEESKILSAQTVAATGDYDTAGEMLQQLLGKTNNADLRYAAYMTLATMADHDLSEKIRYLEYANKEQETDDVQRLLAKAYMQMAEQSELDEVQTLYQNAARCYATLCHRSPRLSDWLGYVAASRAAGNLEAAESVIDKLLLLYPKRYEMAAQAALTKRQLGKTEEAKQYARQAQSVATEEEQRENAELWQALTQILAEA